MENEIWRPVVGYEGLYEVSNFGRVKSLARETNNQYCKEDRILKLKSSKTGYLSVGLKSPGEKQKLYLVHRLVAEVFIPNPYNLPQVNHKDEDKTNNCICNLEWCDAKYNNSYGNHPKTYEQTIFKHNRPDKSKPVLQYDLEGNLIAKFPSTAEAQRCTGIRHQQINGCCRGEYGYKTAGGFIWKYADLNLHLKQ